MFAKYKYILLAFLIVILMRVPALIMWSPNITGSDSAIYMETARNVAEGKGFVSSICRFNMDIDTLTDYVDKYGNRYQGWSRAPIYTYMMSGIYLLTGMTHFMTGVNILNLLLLLASLFIIYRFMLRKFPEYGFAHFLALLCIGGSYTLFEYSFGAWLESFTLFNFVVVFVCHSHIVNNEKVPVWHYILYSLALASLFSIKRANMPMAAAFMLHLLLCGRFKRIFTVSFYFAAFLALWYGLRFYVMSTPPLLSFSHSFPFDGYSREVSALPKFFFSPQICITVLQKIATIALDWRNLGLLFPFTIFYLAASPNNRDKQSIWLLLAVNLGIYAFSRGTPNPRYIFPLFVPLIIFSTVLMEQSLLALFKDRQLIPRYVVVMLVLFFQIYCVANFSQWIPVSAQIRNQIFSEADKMLEDNRIPTDAIILSNIVGYNLYTDHGYILVPPNTDLENKEELLDLYKVDYVLHYFGLTRYFGWNEYTVKKDEFYDMVLTDVSDKDQDLRLYRVTRAAENNQ
jgi:hypothetical protein